MRRIFWIAMVTVSFAFAKPALAETQSALGPYAALIHEAMNGDGNIGGCKNPVPDGGPGCRGIKVVHVENIPLNDAQKMNGIMAFKSIEISFSYYEYEQWNSKERYYVKVLQTKDGWRLWTWND